MVVQQLRTLQTALLVRQALKTTCSLKELILCDNCINADGVRILAAGLCENTTLTLLDLNNNPVGDEGAAVLAETVLPTNRCDSGDDDSSGGGDVRMRLEHLSLWNTGIGLAGGQAFASGLQQLEGGHPTLVKINLMPGGPTTNAVPQEVIASIARLLLVGKEEGEGGENDGGEDDYSFSVFD